MEYFKNSFRFLMTFTFFNFEIGTFSWIWSYVPTVRRKYVLRDLVECIITTFRFFHSILYVLNVNQLDGETSFWKSYHERFLTLYLILVKKIIQEIQYKRLIEIKYFLLTFLYKYFRMVHSYLQIIFKRIKYLSQ